MKVVRNFLCARGGELFPTWSRVGNVAILCSKKVYLEVSIWEFHAKLRACTHGELGAYWVYGWGRYFDSALKPDEVKVLAKVKGVKEPGALQGESQAPHS